ncbi:YqaA family protein [Marinivivus vitaminiproducens]|uniref:YqaA family protein n=1 Tax=Marinivivus vitaminiproducens TaxID=3035935 RepID=UPI00279FD919|nr:DedA family protein [Geminicoccaceae bacterium SCSIO 64248]
MSPELLAYVGLFWSAFLAATLLPGASEAVLIALMLAGAGNPWGLLASATVGNTLGSVVNWLCGRFLGHYRDRRWFPVSPLQLARWSAIFQRYGLPSLFFAWVPVIGDALTVVAGTFRVPLLPFTVLVGIGKLGRYVAIMLPTYALIDA